MIIERRNMIREYVLSNGEASVAELLRLCGNCSNMTLWRDLKALENEGCIRRTRGGVISTSQLSSHVEGLYSRRAKENVKQKRDIAAAALPFVNTGMSVYMDAGSTIMSLARMLPDQHYNIITSGANVAIELSMRRSCNVILVGGQISGNTLSCSGPQAESFLDNVNIDTALMATSGYTRDGGFMSGSFSERELKSKVIKKAARVVMLMDSSKIGRALPYTFARFEDIDILVIDSEPDTLTKNECAQNGVKLLLAKEKPSI